MRYNANDIKKSYQLDRNCDSSNTTTLNGVIPVPFTKISREFAPFIYIFLCSDIRITGVYAANTGVIATTTGVFTAITGVIAATTPVFTAITGVIAATTPVFTATTSVFTAATGVFTATTSVFKTTTGVLFLITGVYALKTGAILAWFYLLSSHLSIAARQSIQYIIGFRWFNHYPDWFRAVGQV